jgi:hypothetical protein
MIIRFINMPKYSNQIIAENFDKDSLVDLKFACIDF